MRKKLQEKRAFATHSTSSIDKQSPNLYHIAPHLPCQTSNRSLQPVPFEKDKAFGRENDHHLREGVHKYEEVIFVHIPKTAGRVDDMRTSLTI